MNWTQTRQRLIECGIDAERLPEEWLPNIDLRGANLKGADLRGADLGDANLGEAYFGEANLGKAYLRSANLGDAYLRSANLIGANLSDANLRGTYLPTFVKVKNLDTAILEIIEAENGDLEMSTWYNCRSSLAITLAGPAGIVLKDIYGPSVAGAIIYASSYPDLPVPDFEASNEDALADIRRRAEKDSL